MSQSMQRSRAVFCRLAILLRFMVGVRDTVFVSGWQMVAYSRNFIKILKLDCR